LIRRVESGHHFEESRMGSCTVNVVSSENGEEVALPTHYVRKEDSAAETHLQWDGHIEWETDVNNHMIITLSRLILVDPLLLSRLTQSVKILCPVHDITFSQYYTLYQITVVALVVTRPVLGVGQLNAADP
jgi:hypothetical protein